MKKEELLCYIWLSLRCGAGSEEASHLLDAFDGAGNVYAAKRDELAAVCDNDATVDSLCDKNMSMPKKILDFCIKNDVGILTCDSEYYPSRLRSIYAKPIVLYCKGKMRDLDKNVLIACVGTRNCTEYGRTMAYKMGAELAKKGVLDKYGVQVIGVQVDAIERGEDRIEFKKTMEKLGIEMARSEVAYSVEEAKKIAARAAWKNFIKYYEIAFDEALRNTAQRIGG